MADTLTTLEKATIVKADQAALPGGSFSVTSSDPGIASVGGDGFTVHLGEHSAK